MGLPQNLLALCKSMLPGDKQRGRPDAATFQSLRQFRHDADYNILQRPKKTDARQAVRDAERVFKLWENIKGSEEARLFLLALLLDERVKKRG